MGLWQFEVNDNIFSDNIISDNIIRDEFSIHKSISDTIISDTINLSVLQLLNKLSLVTVIIQLL